jgi:hypothetical protein
MKDVNEVGLILLNSIAKLKYRNISSISGAKAYLRGYRSTKGILEHPGTNYSIESMLSSLSSLRSKVENNTPDTLSDIISGRKYYYLMAIDDAIDVVESMNIRFISSIEEARLED